MAPKDSILNKDERSNKKQDKTGDNSCRENRPRLPSLIIPMMLITILYKYTLQRILRTDMPIGKKVTATRGDIYVDLYTSVFQRVD